MNDSDTTSNSNQSTPPNKTAIVLFCKLPYITNLHTLTSNHTANKSIQCKTRLSNRIGVEQCNLFVWSTIRDLLIELNGIQHIYNNTSIDIIIYYTPCEHEHIIQYELQRLQLDSSKYILWATDHTIELYQNNNTLHSSNDTTNTQTSNLTIYLQSALYRLSCSNYTHTILIGSDCIDISCHILYNAIDTIMQPNTSYIIPAMDGGYCLLGIPIYNTDNTVLYNIFMNVQWSTDTTSQTQRDQLIQSGLAVIDGATLSDIDDIADLRVLCDRMRQSPELRKRCVYTALFCAELISTYHDDTALHLL